MASVIYKTGKEVKVKNLGWLLKHWKEVEYFRLTEYGLKSNGLMVAVMKDHSKYRSYVIDWASYDYMKVWLDRPVFRGIKIEERPF